MLYKKFDESMSASVCLVHSELIIDMVLYYGVLRRLYRMTWEEKATRLIFLNFMYPEIRC